MGRFSLWFGHGDNDPHGLELNDGLRYHVLSVDEGKPDEQIDQREIVVHVLTQASTVAMARRQISELARLIMRAAQRNAGTVKPTTLRVSGPELRTMWWDVLSVDTDEGP